MASAERQAQPGARQRPAAGPERRGNQSQQAQRRQAHQRQLERVERQNTERIEGQRYDRCQEPDHDVVRHERPTRRRSRAVQVLHRGHRRIARARNRAVESPLCRPPSGPSAPAGCSECPHRSRPTAVRCRIGGPWSRASARDPAGGSTTGPAASTRRQRRQPVRRGHLGRVPRDLRLPLGWRPTELLANDLGNPCCHRQPLARCEAKRRPRSITSASVSAASSRTAWISSATITGLSGDTRCTSSGPAPANCRTAPARPAVLSNQVSPLCGVQPQRTSFQFDLGGKSLLVQRCAR